MIKDRSNDQKQIAQNRQHLHTPRLALNYTAKAPSIGAFLLALG